MTFFQALTIFSGLVWAVYNLYQLDIRIEVLSDLAHFDRRRWQCIPILYSYRRCHCNGYCKGTDVTPFLFLLQLECTSPAAGTK